MSALFHTSLSEILKRIDEIDPVKYGKTRNYIHGGVSYLSPYISRGVISTRMVLERVLERGYELYQIESFVKELCWRDYFQRVGQEKDLNLAVRQEQTPIAHFEIPVAILNAQTGIHGIDQAIRNLYDTGYMHNHCRMYTAFLTCNLAKSHWLEPSKWMYYHLLDGDWASNICSWQWVAGANSSKKYYANQENVNKYIGTNQTGTYIDKSYEEIASSNIPPELTETHKLSFSTSFPDGSINHYNPDAPTFVYNYYNMDPFWHQNETGNRVLLLEPDFFKAYPVSKACIDFVLELGKNIPDLQVYVGGFASLVQHHPASEFIFKEHPLNKGYAGTEEPRDWLTPEVSGFYPSFFAFWKKAERLLRKQTTNKNHI